MQSNTTQGHLGSSKTLKKLRKWFFTKNLAPKVHSYVNSCQMCTGTKRCQNSCIRPPSERIYHSSDGPEDIMESDLVGELTNSNGYIYVLTAYDMFCPGFICPGMAVPLRKLDTISVVRELLLIFTQHAYVRKHLFTDKSTTFTLQFMTEFMQASGIEINHATLKHTQKIGMVESTHQKLKHELKINVTADTPQWDQYVNITVLAYNTTYHRSIECTPTEIFQGRVPHNALDLNFSKPLQTRSTKTDMTNLVAKVNQKNKENASNFFEAFTKYKNYYDQKTQPNRWK